MCQLGTSDFFYCPHPFSRKTILILQKIHESSVGNLKKMYLCGRKSLKNGIELKWLQEKAERIP